MSVLRTGDLVTGISGYTDLEFSVAEIICVINATTVNVKGISIEEDAPCLALRPGETMTVRRDVLMKLENQTVDASDTAMYILKISGSEGVM